MKSKANATGYASKIDDQDLERLFVSKLLLWNRKKNSRSMPWKGEKDPYKIWLSEVILQQTRVEQGLKYYQNFISAFPDIHTLAKAPEEKIYKLWEGLGYYNRCKNLIITANFVAKNLKGVFPNDFNSILQLKGVGNYTASAIASFAYNLPHAVLDGNVFRILSRVFDVEIPIDSHKGKEYFFRLAQRILPKKKAAEYNQAIMDFGALVCRPTPECLQCGLNKFCRAFRSGKQDLLPVKEKTQKVSERRFNYFVIKHGGQVLIHQRISKDIWQNLFEFVLIETKSPFAVQKLVGLLKKQWGIDNIELKKSSTFKQRLSHQLIHFTFLEVELKSKVQFGHFCWVKFSELNKYAFPKTLQEFVRTL